MKKHGVIIMIGPASTRDQRAKLGPAGTKDSGAMADEGPEDVGEGPTATVPLSSVSADGTPPQVGDTVKFSIEGTVQDITGSNAEIEINSIDGEAVDTSGDTGADTGESTADMGARLRKQTVANDTGY